MKMIDSDFFIIINIIYSFLKVLDQRSTFTQLPSSSEVLQLVGADQQLRTKCPVQGHFFASTPAQTGIEPVTFQVQNNLHNL